MKKPIWIAFGYAIAAMACGVFTVNLLSFLILRAQLPWRYPMYIYLCWAQLYFWQ